MKVQQISIVVIACLLQALAKTGRAGPSDVNLGNLCTFQTNSFPVRSHGTVIDVFADEVDRHFVFLLVKDAEFTLPVAVPNTPLADLKVFVNAKVSFTGLYSSTLGDGGDRRYSGPFIGVRSKADITILQPPPADPYDVPELESTLIADPHAIAKLDRRKVEGRVLAIWDSQNTILHLADGSNQL